MGLSLLLLSQCFPEGYSDQQKFEESKWPKHCDAINNNNNNNEDFISNVNRNNIYCAQDNK